MMICRSLFYYFCMSSQEFLIQQATSLVVFALPLPPAHTAKQVQKFGCSQHLAAHSNKTAQQSVLQLAHQTLQKSIMQLSSQLKEEQAVRMKMLKIKKRALPIILLQWPCDDKLIQKIQVRKIKKIKYTKIFGFVFFLEESSFISILQHLSIDVIAKRGMSFQPSNLNRNSLRRIKQLERQFTTKSVIHKSKQLIYFFRYLVDWQLHFFLNYFICAKCNYLVYFDLQLLCGFALFYFHQFFFKLRLIYILFGFLSQINMSGLGAVELKIKISSRIIQTGVGSMNKIQLAKYNFVFNILNTERFCVNLSFLIQLHAIIHIILISINMEGTNHADDAMFIKKDIFIKARKQDIRLYYEFSPKILGRGAYGVVYKARLKQPPHTYRVVKLIAKKMVKNPESLQNEVQILKKLDHPMIVRLYQTFEDEKNIYLVQDYCQGGQLFERLEQHGNFDEKDARQIFTQIIKCIRYLHSQKIAHRDLKPQNFLMSSKKTLEMKLIDFGLSYEWKNNMRNEMIAQKKNKLIGTSYYIASEVLQLDYDERCDIWSAGVILYILVTAAPPFDGENDRQIMENVKTMKYTFNIPEAKHLSAEVKDLISRILVTADKRITIDEILAHPWMTKQLPSISLQLDFKKLKNFSNFSKLKALATTYIATQLPEKDIHQLGQLFEQIDTNSDGYLTIEQLQAALDKQHENTNYAELRNIIDHIDTDKNGKINYNEFLASCLESSFLQNEEYVSYVFRGLDADHSGKISKAQIKKIYEQAGIKTLKNADLDQIVESCDKDKDGEIDYHEFLEALGINK